MNATHDPQVTSCQPCTSSRHGVRGGTSNGRGVVEATFYDNVEEGQADILVDAHAAGFVSHEIEGHRFSFILSKIGPQYAGQGLATSLAAHVLADARRCRYEVLPYFSYAATVIRENPAPLLGLVPVSPRSGFGT